MTDRQWYAMLNKAYDAKAAELVAAGWKVQNQGQQFVEHFTNEAGEKIQIRRRLGDTRWFTEQYMGW